MTQQMRIGLRLGLIAGISVMIGGIALLIVRSRSDTGAVGENLWRDGRAAAIPAEQVPPQALRLRRLADGACLLEDRQLASLGEAVEGLRTLDKPRLAHGIFLIDEASAGPEPEVSFSLASLCVFAAGRNVTLYSQVKLPGAAAVGREPARPAPGGTPYVLVQSVAPAEK